jgi:hypothetical protein
MDQESYNGQTITQYLLGFLSQAETEHFDELSIADDEFADALRAAENDLVDAYAQGELTAPESERFKSHYLASSLRREKAMFAEEFQRSSQKSAIEQAAQGQREWRSDQRKKAGLFSGPGVFSGSGLAWQWGFAVAAIVLVIVGGLLLFQNVRLRQQMMQTQARHDEILQREQQLQQDIEAQRLTNSKTEQELARSRDERERLEQELKKAQVGAKPAPLAEGSILAVILAPPLRGGGQPPTVSIKTGTSAVAMQLQLEAADYPAYRVTLIDLARNVTLWRSGSQKPLAKGERRALSVSFPTALLKSQNYILRVSGIPSTGGSEIVGDYPFKVLK